MTDTSSVTMDQEAVDTLLEATTTGVLSLSSPDEDSPRSIPVSFGYDPVESVFYFRLADGDEKGTLDGRPASFVVHARDEETGDWQSVVAHGELERTRNEDIALDTLEGLERVDIPLVDIFGEPTSDVEFEFFRLLPETLTGRRED